MQSKAQRIIDILIDYENNTMSADHVLDWVSQFDEADRGFILDELAVIFQKTYISKEKCISLIKNYIVFWTNKFKYTSVQAFLLDTVFLDLQSPGKSQKELLAFFNEIISDTYGVSLMQCGQNAKHYIYLDDVLSTGNTVYRQLESWLTDKSERNALLSNYEYIKNKGLTLHVCLLCAHTWGMNNIEFRFMKAFGNDVKKHIKYQWYHLVDNNLKAFNPKLNHMLPVEDQPTEIQQYLASLDFANANEDRAYRKTTQPVTNIIFISGFQNSIRKHIFEERCRNSFSRPKFTCAAITATWVYHKIT